MLRRNHSGCRLPLLDPWDQEVVPYLDASYDPTKECQVTRTMQTELKDNQLRMLNILCVLFINRSKCLDKIQSLFLYYSEYDFWEYKDLQSEESYKSVCKIVRHFIFKAQNLLRTSECQYRCLYNAGEKDYKSGTWIKMIKGKTFREECDFIETHCTSTNNTTFRYIHSQASI